MRDPYVVRVHDLLTGREARKRVQLVAPLELGLQQAETEGEARLDIELERRDDRIGAEGTVEVRAHLTCVRCLRTWTEALAVHVSASFAQSMADYPITPDGTIDLSQPVRDDVAEALPLLPLCRPDCAGLCPVCGVDLNAGRCPGHDTHDESPFGPLRQLILD